MLVVLNTEMENMKINSYNDAILNIFIVFPEQEYVDFIQIMYNMESIESGECAQETYTFDHVNKYITRYVDKQFNIETTRLPFDRLHFQILFTEKVIYSDIAQLVQKLLYILKMSKENE